MERVKIIKKVEEFVGRDVELTLERYYEIRLEWNKANKMEDKGELTYEEVSDIHKKLWEEAEKVEIKFDNEKDFREFGNLLILFGELRPTFILKQTEHEIEHSKIYKKEGIKSYFGWHKFKGNIYCSFQKPFGAKYDSLSPSEKDKRLYKSLKIVSILSESDKKAIINLEEKYGDKIKD